MASIVERNIAKLGNKFLENIEYEDLDYRGFLGETKSPTIKDGAVLVNDLKMWLQSSRGDYYRRWTLGGYFDTKARSFPLNDEGAVKLKEDLQLTVEKQFPSVEVINLVVTPIQQRRAWKISMIVRDRYTGVYGPFEAGVSVPE
jgi:hypothetical protein